MFTFVRTGACGTLVAFTLAASAAAQSQPSTPPPAEPPQEHMHEMPEHDMSAMDMGSAGAPRWMLMQDGSAYLVLNHQGGDRGGTDVVAPNWWMGMGTRRLGAGTMALSGMFSVDPATVGGRGYRELFQVGEAYDGAPNVDRQHPHDALMQMAAWWRAPIGGGTSVTLAGALAGEPALGPVAFMHRASVAAIPFAPLGHHTFDSTHVAFGVLTAGLDRGWIAAEGSVFNGREPDQRRWNLDLGRLDSVSGRLWLRPAPRVELQVSTGRLVEPEQLHEGNVQRTTASASYLSTQGPLTAVTVGAGMNASGHVTRRALFAEGTRGVGRQLLSLRAELVEVESELLRTIALPTTHEGEERKDPVGALTLGWTRDVVTGRKGTASIGANLSMYRVPALLQPTHGAHPASFQLFVQVRPSTGSMGRMWNMRMAARPMGS